MDFWRGFSARSVNEDRLIEQFVIHADNASNIRRLTPKRKVARWSRAGGTISLSTSAPLRFLLHTSGQPTIRILFWSGPEFLIQMEESDLQLVLACRRGDQLAWERLIRRYQRLIYAIPLRAGLDEDHAAEIFQDVFTTLFQKLNDLEQPEKLQAWLVTTTRRKSLHAISKAQVQQQSYVNNDDPPDMATLIRDEAPLPEEQLLILEEQHRLRIALSSLDERCRALLEMLFYRAEPPTYAEIATSLEIPEGSVGPTRARCLAKLLRLLKK